MITRHCTIHHRKPAGVGYTPAVVAGKAVGNAQMPQGDHPAALDLKYPPGIVSVDGDGMPAAVYGQSLPDGQGAQHMDFIVSIKGDRVAVTRAGYCLAQAARAVIVGIGNRQRCGINRGDTRRAQRAHQ